MSDQERRGGPRAKYLRLGERVGQGAEAVANDRAANDRAANDTAPAFTVTVGELQEMVRGAVSEALAERAGGPVLLDRDALAARLGCGVGLVDKLRREGMPHVRLGDSPRFELERCLEFLRGKEGAA